MKNVLTNPHYTHSFIIVFVSFISKLDTIVCVPCNNLSRMSINENVLLKTSKMFYNQLQ